MSDHSRLVGEAESHQTARQLEDDRIAELRDEMRAAVRRRLSELELSARSREGYVKELTSMLHAQMEAFIGSAVDVRHELIGRCARLASEEEMATLERQLYAEVDAVFSLVEREVQVEGGGALYADVVESLSEWRLAMKSRAKRKLNIARNEIRLPAPAPSAAASGINVSAGHGSIVTFGDVSGSIVSTFGKADSDSELSRALSQLARAVERSTELTSDVQKDVLVSLQFIAQQAVAEPALREKAGIIRSVWNGILSSLAVAGDVASICGVAGPLVLQHFGK